VDGMQKKAPGVRGVNFLGLEVPRLGSAESTHASANWTRLLARFAICVDSAVEKL